MSSGHNHSHGHGHGKASSQKTLILALTITLAYALVEAIGGWWANSLALIGDAGHMLTDALALAAGAFAAWLARKPASARHSYGLQRAEVVGALFNVLFMYVIVAAIVVSAIGRLQQPEPVAFASVMLIGSIGLGINLFVVWLLNRGEQTLNTRGAMLHVMGDLLGSVAAIVAGLVIWLTGWMPIDPMLSLLICILIVISSTRLLLETINVVMEAVPAGIDLDVLRKAMCDAHPAITGVHHLHVWTVSSSTRALSAQIELKSMSEWAAVLSVLQQRLAAEFGIDHPTLQPELDKHDTHNCIEPNPDSR